MSVHRAPMTFPYEMRPATVDDAEAYVRCHVDCLAETYETVMPPAFAEQHRQAISDRIVETRGLLAGRVTGRSAGVGGGRPQVWLARDRNGTTVGVARSGPGPQQWEVDFGAPQPPVHLELNLLYTRQRTHGTGVGQALFDVAVGEHDAYLWILHGNARAERFYRRNGFVPDGVEMSCGPTWFHRSIFRMVRGAPVWG